jgi:hypothetical protein
LEDLVYAFLEILRRHAKREVLDISIACVVIIIGIERAMSFNLFSLSPSVPI